MSDSPRRRRTAAHYAWPATFLLLIGCACVYGGTTAYLAARRAKTPALTILQVPLRTATAPMTAYLFTPRGTPLQPPVILFPPDRTTCASWVIPIPPPVPTSAMVHLVYSLPQGEEDRGGFTLDSESQPRGMVCHRAPYNPFGCLQETHCPLLLGLPSLTTGRAKPLHTHLRLCHEEDAPTEPALPSVALVGLYLIVEPGTTATPRK